MAVGEERDVTLHSGSEVDYPSSAGGDLRDRFAAGHAIAP
jgi:hypothetical protein